MESNTVNAYNDNSISLSSPTSNLFWMLLELNLSRIIILKNQLHTVNLIECGLLFCNSFCKFLYNFYIVLLTRPLERCGYQIQFCLLIDLMELEPS